MSSLQLQLFSLQRRIEQDYWPFGKTRGSTVNLSFRDTFFTVLIVTVFVVLYRYAGPGAAWMTLAVAAWIDPAVIAFGFNTLQGLVLRTPRFWDIAAVEPKLTLLTQETHFGRIRAEVLSILADPRASKPSFSDVSPHQRNIAAGQPWTVFPFWAYETVNYSNCARAPILTSILRQIPSVRLAMLSIMSEGAEIPEHCGYFKSVLRVHLTVHVDHPDPNMQRYIEVGGERHSWKQGELVAFDDTYPHSVVNRVPGRRVVLFLDVDRPYETSAMRKVSNAFLKLMRASPSVRAHAALQEKTHRFK